MFLRIVNLLLGDIGRFLRDLYFENAVWINAIVVLYALGIIWNHGNLRKLYFNIEKLILDHVQTGNNGLDTEKIFDDFSEAWLKLYTGVNFIVPSASDLWFEKINAKDVLSLFFIDKPFVKMVLHENTGSPSIKVFSPEEYRVWLDYVHNMRRGLRFDLKNPYDEIERIKSKVLKEKLDTKIKRKKKK